MKRQAGAALIVVMSLLAVSLTLGLMSMQTSQVDERLAGNYRASALAQMAAEQGASDRVYKVVNHEASFNEGDDYISCVVLADNYGDHLDKFEFGGFESVVDHGSFVAGYYYAGCQDDGDDADLIMGQVRQEAGEDITDFFAIHFLAVVNRPGDGGGGNGNGGDSDVLTINGSPPILNPLVCLVDSSCGWDDDVASYFDARPYPVPADFGCSGVDSCRTELEDPNAERGEFSKNYSDAKGKWEAFLEGLVFDEVIAGGGGRDLSQGVRGVYRNVEIVSGGGGGSDRVTSGGGVNTSGVLIVRSGAEFRGQGTGHHEGLIIVEDGGSIDLVGNYTVYGAIVALGDIKLDISGNPEVRYHANSSGEAGRPDAFVWQIL